MLDAVQSAAAAKGVRCLRIDGATPASERQALVHTFQGLPAASWLKVAPALSEDSAP